jgi:hypothetical protein
VDENDCRYALLPGLISVAHGGAGTGPSSADPNHEIIDSACERTELGRLERHPGVALVGAFDCGRPSNVFERALEARPELARRLILVPDIPDSASDSCVQPAALRLFFDSWVTYRTDELDHEASMVVIQENVSFS